MEDELNGNDLNWREPQCKTSSMEDNLNERRPEWKKKSMEDNLNGRQPQWKTTSMEDNIKEALQEADDISLPS